jgi:methyl-accepting chemotaxis protein
MKTSFLHNMSNQMLEPTSTLIDDVNKLYDIIGNGDVPEVNSLVSDIERQGLRMTSLLNRLLQQSATKEEKGGRS